MTQISHPFRALILTTDRAIANAFAALIAEEPGDATIFDRADPLRLIGSQGEATAWQVCVPMTPGAAGATVEFAGPGPYPTINALGKTDADIAAGKAVMLIELGHWRDILDAYGGFAGRHGYEQIPSPPPAL